MPTYLHECLMSLAFAFWQQEYVPHPDPVQREIEENRILGFYRGCIAVWGVLCPVAWFAIRLVFYSGTLLGSALLAKYHGLPIGPTLGLAALFLPQVRWSALTGLWRSATCHGALDVASSVNGMSLRVRELEYQHNVTRLVHSDLLLKCDAAETMATKAAFEVQAASRSESLRQTGSAEKLDRAVSPLRGQLFALRTDFNDLAYKVHSVQSTAAPLPAALAATSTTATKALQTAESVQRLMMAHRLRADGLAADAKAQDRLVHDLLVRMEDMEDRQLEWARRIDSEFGALRLENETLRRQLGSVVERAASRCPSMESLVASSAAAADQEESMSPPMIWTDSAESSVACSPLLTPTDENGPALAPMTTMSRARLNIVFKSPETAAFSFDSVYSTQSIDAAPIAMSAKKSSGNKATS